MGGPRIWYTKKNVPFPRAAQTKPVERAERVRRGWAGGPGGEAWVNLSGNGWSERLFDGFPEPVLLLREGRVAYRNQAAAGRFPGLRAGDEVPEDLSRLLGEATPPAAAAGEVAGWSCTASLQEVDGGTLVVLRAREEGSGQPGLEGLALQLRRETAALSIALQRLDPTEEVPDEARAKQYLSAANRGLYRIIRLADHLTLCGGAEGQWSPRGMDLAGLCRETAEEVEGVCRMGGYDFTWELESAGLLIVGDDRLLKRMLLCLVSNAMKAAGRTGKLGLRLTVRGGRAVITVWNTGRPLEERDVARMFSGDRAPAMDIQQGLGLGLEVVRRTAALHGGTVLAESREGVTRCVVSLPIQKPEEGEPLRTPRVDYSGGFLPVLVELSDVLPPEIYRVEDLQ